MYESCGHYNGWKSIQQAILTDLIAKCNTSCNNSYVEYEYKNNFNETATNDFETDF